MNKENEIELPDHTIKELCEIGLEVVLNRYFEKLKDRAEDDGEEWDDERMNIVGQNGNDGLHYVDYGAGKRGIQHKMKAEFGKLGEVWDDEKEDTDAL